MSYFSVFLSRIMQNSCKGWTTDQNTDSAFNTFLSTYSTFIHDCSQHVVR